MAAEGREIGLVLGGGGARGLAHLGVLRVFQREQIPVSHIVGTSMGGLVGALYAAGLPLDDVEEEVTRLSRFTEQLKLVDINISASGLSVRGRRIYNLLADLLGPELTFSDLKLPFAAVATDIRSGRDVVLQGGLVIDAIRATISIPGVFMPVDLGDYRLVDGGVLDNVPVDVARRMGAHPVVAVDVLPSFSQNWPGQDPVEMGLTLTFVPESVREIYHVLMIMLAAQTEQRLADYPPDVLIRPVLPPEVTLLVGFNRAVDIIAAGEAAAEAALPEVRRLIVGS